MPKISVIMSVFNGDQYLTDCIDSILIQTFDDFEFLITDDCSSDTSLEIIDSYQKRDKRIKVIKNEKNIGLTKSLNNMIDMASGEYVARMDADDISLPQRFEKQVSYMQENKEIGICSVNTSLVGENLSVPVRRNYFLHHEIKALMLFTNAIPHAPTMIRGDLFHQNHFRYNEEFRIIQDYELWQRLIRVTRFHLLKEVLFQSRHHDDRVTVTSSKTKNLRKNYLFRIYQNALEDFGVEVTPDLLSLHLSVAGTEINQNFENITKVHDYLLTLKMKNDETHYFETRTFQKILSSLWFSYCTRSTSLGYDVYKIYASSELAETERHFKLQAKLFFKCLIKYRAVSRGRYI